MIQQVNLLAAPKNRVEQALSLWTLMSVISTLVVGVGAMSGFIYMQTEAVAKEVTNMEVMQHRSQQAIARFVKNNPVKTSSRLLVQNLTDKTRSLATVQKLINAIANSAGANRTGFSPYMEGFARKRVSNLWLTGFELSGGGRFMRISGNAMQPKSVPKFLKSLSSADVFKGREFSDLKISRSQQESQSWVNFSVQTRSLEGH